ncbi:hypothetical protein [Plantactinospora sp. CA-290183]|uniref:hypothetical protein n=1 Tax=Plantactinospora sp. CA-290183 TaxID=3240006 RepID=UPI003D8F06CF
MESVHPPADSQVTRVPTQRTPPGQAVPEPVAPPPAPPPRRRLRLALAVVGGALALLCLGGAAVAYVAYDRFTAPDRSAPDVVVDSYLRAYLVDRNDVLADQMVCAESSLGDLHSLRSELRAREQRFQVTFDVKWGPLDVRKQDSSAEVSVELQIRYAEGGLFQVDHQRWRFTVREEDGWRVCQAAPAG